MSDAKDGAPSGATPSSPRPSPRNHLPPIEHSATGSSQEEPSIVESAIDAVEHEISDLRHMSAREIALHAFQKEAPYVAMLSLAVLGTAYVSFSGEPSPVLWVALAPLFGAICVFSGWARTKNSSDRMRLVSTQALHWLAVIVAMGMIYSPTMRAVANNNAAGLMLLTVLSLSTFLAGVHTASWQICFVGLFLALVAPMLAWIEQSSLLVIVLLIGAAGAAGSLWWFLYVARPKSKAAKEINASPPIS